MNMILHLLNDLLCTLKFVWISRSYYSRTKNKVDIQSTAIQQFIHMSEFLSSKQTVEYLK